MNKLPRWAKALAVILLFAALFGAARLLIMLDQMSTGKFGID